VNKLLILYPDLFTCQSKFDRKVRTIISRMNGLTVVFPKDPNGYIQEFFEKSAQEVELCLREGWKAERNITHAIVFDDSEGFVEDISWLENSGTQLRLIKILLTRVVNIRSEPKCQNQRSSTGYEYIGRGSYWGNPYSMYEEGKGREEVIQKYQYDFERDLFPNKKKSEVFKLNGKRLGCFCKPAACHGDVLADYLNSYDDGK